MRVPSIFRSGAGRFSAGLIIGLFVAGGIAVAAIPSTSGRITACYATTGSNKGVVRIIDSDSGERCKSNERAIAWSMAGLRFRGAWSSTVNYAVDDVVTKDGSSYVATVANRNVAPPNASKWAALALKGANGSDGEDGEDATMIVANQECVAPYLLVGYDSAGTIICNSPVDADSDHFFIDAWNTDPSLQEDCDDTDSSVYPGATEVADDGIDQDCDGSDLVSINCDDGDPYTSDESDGTNCIHLPQLFDVDGDSWAADMAIGGYPDCDDTDASINPVATDTPNDGIDQDCAGGDLVVSCDDGDPYTHDAYEGAGCINMPQSADVDGDGSQADQAIGGSPDCDDTDPNIYPGAYDTPDDGIDQDCDGVDFVTT